MAERQRGRSGRDSWRSECYGFEVPEQEEVSKELDVEFAASDRVIDSIAVPTLADLIEEVKNKSRGVKNDEAVTVSTLRDRIRVLERTLKLRNGEIERLRTALAVAQGGAVRPTRVVRAARVEVSAPEEKPKKNKPQRGW